MNLRRAIDYHVEGPFTDPQRGVMYFQVTLDADERKRVERAEVSAEELQAYSQQESAGASSLATLLAERVRDAAARLAGYTNFAALVRDAKQKARP